MIENLDQLAKFVKGGADVLQNAINSEEKVSLELIEGSFVSDSELNTLKDSRFNDGKKEGQTIGYDFAMKDIKKDFSIELEGKDRTKIADAIKNKIMSDAKIEPNKKVDEYKSSLESLQKKYETDLNQKSSELQQLNNKLSEYKVNGDLVNHLPEGLNGIDANDFITLAKTSAKFEYEDGQLVVKKGDSIIKDKLEKPISPKDYLTDFATSKQWINTDGRGGGDNGGSSNGSFKTMNDVYKHMQDNNVNPMSPEGKKLIADFENSNN